MKKLTLIPCVAGLVIGACTPGADVPGPSLMPDKAETDVAYQDDAGVQRLTIAGCCAFEAPADAQIIQNQAMTRDGFRPIRVNLDDDSVTIEPILGSHGYLEARDGVRSTLDGRDARTLTSSGGSTIIVVPLVRAIDGRTAAMSIRLTGNCQHGNCDLLDDVVKSFTIEGDWSSA